MARIKPIKVARRGKKRGPGQSDRLLNLGPKSSGWLAEAGIRTREQLAALGPIGACRHLREHGRPVSLLLAYAIEGALTGQHWNALSLETKAWLQAEFRLMKRTAARPPH